MTMCLAEASFRVLQANAVLSMWLEGVHEAIEEGDSKLINTKTHK
ncbi:Uncharacterised protein [Enterobacter hormaechei]|nr:Uncharacterised protein [Enterobacter hormaechei]